MRESKLSSFKVISLKFRFILLLSSLTLLTSCSKSESQLEQIQQRNEIKILSRYSPTSYYQKGDDLVGLEYELAELFAQHLGVKLNIIVPDNLGDMLHLLERGYADLAAAGLTITPEREKSLRFGPVYQEVTQQLIYRRGNRRPKNIPVLAGKLLEVVASSSHVEQLKQHQIEIPELQWVENSRLDSSHLLELVQLEVIDYTVADSNEIAAQQNFFPELRVAFDISEPQPLAWALTLSKDDSLYNEVQQFFDTLSTTGELDRLIEKYYGHIRRFDYVDTRAFYRKIITRLPTYQPLFEKAAAKFNMDWRLLAAMSYQESHWDPQAISHTGVRGLMMITNSTAKQMKIDDRTDPKQSIFAGAGYLTSIKNRLPERILEPDKTWIALASYNIGLGHIEDTRVITQQNNQDPDSWPDIKQNLPLLSKKKWYSKTRHGYARGNEPVRYIENIRRYYDILLYDRDYGIQPVVPQEDINPQGGYSPSAL
jgi:membrane-bound lytic murein transglycosylase F